MKIGIYFCILLFLSGCSLFTPLIAPVLTLKEVRIEKIQLQSAQLVFNLEVDNPNQKDLKIESLSYQLVLNSKTFPKTVISELPILLMGKKTKVEIPFEFLYQDLFDSLGQAFIERRIKYKIEGNAKISFYNLPIHKEEEIRF